MKKTMQFIVTTTMLAFAVMSCATHTTVRTTSYDTGSSYSQGEWRKCAVCNGKGSCSACNGTGRISGDMCRRCMGSGKCSTCSGNGGYNVN